MLVSPPRLRPSPSSAGCWIPFFVGPAGSTTGATRMLVGAGGGAVYTRLPDDLTGRIRAGLRCARESGPRFRRDASDRAGRRRSATAHSAPAGPARALLFGDADRTGTLARSVNEYAAQLVTRHPERFGSFATLPLPDVEAALDELTYALDTLHADGVVLYSNYAGIYLGDSHFNPIFAELDRRAAVVFLHPTVYTGTALPTARNTGSPIPTLPGFMLEFVFDTTRAVADLVLSETLKRYPRVRLILSHAGGTVLFVAPKLVTGGLWMRFAPLLSTAMQLGAGESPALPPEQIEAAIGLVEADIFAQLRGALL